ncbi:MAG TPA: glycosyltransferase family 4 protein [Chthonomonadaceae bacterium]|nr:glycosyltransferase family 4 protein [Chthonomonadaceae bacterium]
MHVACVSYFYDRFLDSPEALLERYETLTGWVEGLAAAGAEVTVVQRFAGDAEIARNGVLYMFVRDPAWRFGSLPDMARQVNRAVARLRPDIVHIHGMGFARQAWWLRRLLPTTPLLLQDHAGSPPTRWMNRRTLRLALESVDAVSFTVPEQARPWIEAGILRADKPLVELPEGSSPFRLRSRAEARAYTGLTGDPLCLWVGRLNANKDPLTVLRGFARTLACLPTARLAMVYSAEDLLPAVQAWLAANPAAASRVRLLGCLPHAELEAIYNSADFFLLGSDYDGGSGYSVLEALSCGVVPIITDIPSFRAALRNGEYGGLWPVGNAEALADTLLAWHRRLQPGTQQRQRDYFEQHLSFEAIGRQALATYDRLLRGTRP